MEFPEGKSFAFTILDDTDDSTLENVRPVYDELRRLGMRTTKTVWPMDCPEGSRKFFAADTLQRKDYLEFVHELARDGFEIAFHGATMESSRRERTIRGLEFLVGEFGVYPRLFCNHGFNRENLYWGRKRFQTVLGRAAVYGMKGVPSEGYYLGDEPGSEFFWGDLCKQHVQYVRNFTFRTLNMLSVNPEMPYQLAATPFVNSWFSTADAPNANVFKEVCSEAKLDQLAEERGACILSTHLGKGFAKQGAIDPEVAGLLRYVASKDGWFVPASTILDHLVRQRKAVPMLGQLALMRLEARFVLDKVLHG